METHADAGVASQSAQAQGVHGAGYACAEVDVMIAEPTARRRGLATESLRLLLGYAALELGTRTFVAKIGFANLASQACFCQNFGFVEVCVLLSLWRSSHSHSTGCLSGLEATTLPDAADRHLDRRRAWFLVYTMFCRAPKCAFLTMGTVIADR